MLKVSRTILRLRIEKNDWLMCLGLEVYSSTWECSSSVSNCACSNRMWIDRICDKIIKVPKYSWAIYVYVGNFNALIFLSM